jgi:ligand-binding sensor domain-containing protein/signal transduction histidine kinase
MKSDHTRWCRWPLRRSIHLLALILLLLACRLTFAAEPQYGLEHWTVEDGLPQDIIRGIAQTPDGYLWITTLDGLVRFDGVRFTIFEKNNTPGMTTNRFRMMYPGRDGDLWLVNEIAGITRLHKGVFQHYGAEQGIPGHEVSAVAVSEEGEVWILADNQILQWHESEGRFVAVTPPHPSDVYYSQMLWDVSGFWTQVGASIHCLYRGRWVDYPVPQGFTHDAVWGAAVDQDGALWVETYRGRQAKIEGDGTAHVLEPNAQPTMRLVDSHGRPWAMNVGDHLTRTLHFQSSGTTVTVPVTGSYEDRQGNLWFGTEGEGLYHVQRQSIVVYSKEQGLVDRDTYAVYQDHPGSLWIGAWHVGLSHFVDGKFTNYSQADGLPGRNITAVMGDREGRIWVTGYGGIAAFENGHLHKVTQPTFKDVVQAICQDRDGALWFGTSVGLGRYKDGVTKMFYMKDGLASDDIHVIIEDQAGDLWVGGYGGLTRIHDGQFTRYTERDGLPGTTIWSIYEDSDGVLWIGTYDGGMARFRDGKFVRYTVKDGLFSNGVFQILEDAHANLWISCNRGIYRVSKRDLNEFADGVRTTITSVAYGKIDGMHSVECNGGLWPAGTKTSDGRLWFPTLDGVAVIDPEAIAYDLQPPPVIIESALLDRAPLPVDTSLRIQPGGRNLEIHYTAPTFVKSAQTHFKYKLEGQDLQWVDAGPRRTAYYAYLPAGDYTFRVIAGNSDGVWNLGGQSIAITVLAPFYQTWWFAALVILLIAAITAIAWRYRVAQLERSRVAQQAFSRQLIASQENERKRIAAELHDSLGQRLVVINNLALFALRGREKNSIEPAAVEEISSETKIAIQETREISYNLRPFQLDRLGLTKAIEVMIRTVARSTAMEITSHLDDIDDLFPEELRINFYRIVQEGLNNVTKHAAATQVDVSIQRSNERTALTIKDNGRGFAKAGPAVASGPGGFGMTGMAERAKLLGGELQVLSESGRGTQMTVVITRHGGRYGRDG